MSRVQNAAIRNLGKIARQTRKGATPAQMFLTGRKAGKAWAHRALNRDLIEDIKSPEMADDVQLRFWLRGLGAGITSAVTEDADPPGEQR